MTGTLGEFLRARVGEPRWLRADAEMMLGPQAMQALREEGLVEATGPRAHWPCGEGRAGESWCSRDVEEVGDGMYVARCPSGHCHGEMLCAEQVLQEQLCTRRVQRYVCRAIDAESVRGTASGDEIELLGHADDVGVYWVHAWAVGRLATLSPGERSLFVALAPPPEGVAALVRGRVLLLEAFLDVSAGDVRWGNPLRAAAATTGPVHWWLSAAGRERLAETALVARTRDTRGAVVLDLRTTTPAAHRVRLPDGTTRSLTAQPARIAAELALANGPVMARSLASVETADQARTVRSASQMLRKRTGVGPWIERAEFSSGRDLAYFFKPPDGVKWVAIL